MNLVIDVGNTQTKIALFAGSEISSFTVLEKFSVAVLQEYLLVNTGAKRVILSAVMEVEDAVIDFLKSTYSLILLNHETIIPIENLYKSPETLGKDRLAAAIGANLLCKNQNVLSVDGGTCIKYDFVNARNQYLGGGISPGIEMRFKALNAFTDKLPHIHFRPYNNLIGINTEESILSGVINGVVGEVKGIIENYEKQYPDIKVVFTGGSLNFFESVFNTGGNGKSNIFADSFLILKGLNHILNFNEKK
jgi:type III pantothenate kinase